MNALQRLAKNFIPQKWLYIYYRRRNKNKFTVQDKIHILEVHLTEHCNLNCASCAHFSVLAKEEFLDLKSFTRDFTRLFKLFGDKIGKVHLMGGEPLLHPDLPVFMKVARESLPNTDIHIVTNGLLLERQRDVFWDACRENKVDVMISKYPIKLNIENIFSIAQKKCVNVQFYANTGKKQLEFNLVPLDESGRQDEAMSFTLCNRACCNSLRAGRIYPCATAAHIRHFNEYFGKNFEIVPEDYIDIHEVKSRDEIMKFLTKPIPFCRYCNIKEKSSNMTWRTSKKAISEWI